MLVHHDAVRAFEARGLRELVPGDDADADDHDVRWMLRAVLADHAPALVRVELPAASARTRALQTIRTPCRACSDS